MTTELQLLLKTARDGDETALGTLLESYRRYLKLLARVQIGQRLQGKADASDIVQETFLDAYRHVQEFRGDSETQLLAWLRTILAAKLADVFRRYLGTKQRDVALERSIEEGFDQSTMILHRGLIAPGSSPSRRVSNQEEAIRLADALGQLPADYRDAIVLRNLEALPFAEVAQRMGKTVNSVEKLWLRGLTQLRKSLETSQ